MIISLSGVPFSASSIRAQIYPEEDEHESMTNAIRPKAKFLSIIGSYGWGGKTVETLSGMIPNLKVDVLEPVLAKGVPTEKDLRALDNLGETIAKKHEEHGIK
jgi:flavorubredoxin